MLKQCCEKKDSLAKLFKGIVQPVLAKVSKFNCGIEIQAVYTIFGALCITVQLDFDIFFFAVSVTRFLADYT